ncbi:MAG: response regulator [Anaerolineae bacterium]|jgi:two-component system cell cycle response regulator DivK|nr:response regulator [Anaerolineae bacterium]MBT3713813.1 response regulator [Anaerolineae bacterium]MBT4310029.1 response regulator [Anaerolineae bacterium]MBT4457439.1 response regulator [Anaerolineae bacterium]MBT4843045.1 response regulator [Anaerolineae bacterium]
MTKILLVEDIEDNASLVKRAVKAKGFDFIWAKNATEGIKVALEEIPDLILLDLGLPDADGQTLSTWIRDEKTLWDIPIIVMTAWPEKMAQQTVEAYQLDGYLGKPFNLKKFWEIIDSFIQK